MQSASWNPNKLPAALSAPGRVALFGCLLAGVLWSGVSSAQSRAVALTFDDLPAVGRVVPPGGHALSMRDTRSFNRTILSALRRHRAPAIGFVNEAGVVADSPAEARAVLRQWLKDGHELGNHTFGHVDLSAMPPDEFEKQIIDGEDSIRPLMLGAGKPLRYLRFPFNHSGATLEAHSAIQHFLAEHGYQTATCTIDTEDYLFDGAYSVALDRRDRKTAGRLRAEYLKYTSAEIDYYTQLHQQVFGHEIPHVMLLHVNRLNAAVMPEILRIFEQKGFRFVTLAEAQSDPAYQTADTFATKFGPMWGYRWARVLGIQVNGRLEPEPPAWIGQYGK